MNERSPLPNQKSTEENPFPEKLFSSGDTEILSNFLQPFTPLAAQFLWFIQPMMGLLGYYETTHQLAERILMSSGLGIQEPHQTDEG